MNALHCILHRSHHLHFLKCSTATLLYFCYLLQVMVHMEIWPFQGQQACLFQKNNECSSLNEISEYVNLHIKESIMVPMISRLMYA